jgi:hypothetical protein
MSANAPAVARLLHLVIRCTLIRMTHVLTSTLAALALLAGVAQAAGGSRPAHNDGVAVVLAGKAAQRTDLIDAAKGVPVRVPRSAAEELAVTHLLAARGERTVIGVGLDRRVAVAPVARRYPGTRFVAVPANARALARAVEEAGR